MHLQRKLGTVLPLFSCFFAAILVASASLAASPQFKHHTEAITGVADAGVLAITVTDETLTTTTRITGALAAVEHTHSHDIYCNHPQPGGTLEPAVPEPVVPVDYTVSSVMWCPDHPDVLVSDGCPIDIPPDICNTGCLW